MVSCGMTFIKYLLFVFNLLFAISGITILAVGATILASQTNLVVENSWPGVLVLIVVGAIVFFISFLGCCGAIKNSNVMVMSFAVLLLIIFILELTAAIAGYVMRSDVHEMVQSGLNKSIHMYENNTQIKEAWNIMQHDIACCGINGPEDWKEVLPNNNLPDQCCPDKDVSDSCTFGKPEPAYYTEGCLMKVENVLETKVLLAGSIGLAVCFVQIFGVILACCLSKAIRKDYETV